MDIYKYPMPSTELEIEVPAGSFPIHAQIQGPPYGGGNITVWMIHQTPKTIKQRMLLKAVNTGDDVLPDEESYFYIGSCESSNGIIWHVFYKWL
jgi:hypothetical protein